MTAGHRAYATNQFVGMPADRIVLELYDAALGAIARAAEAVAASDIPRRGEATGKAIAIVAELQASLDKEAGGDLGERLSALYDYIISELLRGNIEADTARLNKCEELLRQVRDGWEEMMQHVRTEQGSASDYV